MGIVPAPRKRLRVWIENYFQDGSRMAMQAIELDRSEVLRLLQCLADHLEA
jgi:hypothetical protein